MGRELNAERAHKLQLLESLVEQRRRDGSRSRQPRRQIIGLTDSEEEEEDDDVERETVCGSNEAAQLPVSSGQGKRDGASSCGDDLVQGLENLSLAKKETHAPSIGQDTARRGDTCEEESLKMGNECDLLPNHITGRFFPHQKIGFQWLVGLYKVSSGGILADDMGLGKTFQVSAFITALLRSRLASRVLVLAPKTLIQAWKKEIDICGISNRTIEYEGDAKKKKQKMELMVDKGGVLIATYGMVQHNIEQLRGEDCISYDEDDGPLWDVVIMDEGHKLKNRKAQLRMKIDSLPAKTRLVITGTPIQNNLMELHSLFQLVCPELLGSTREFKEMFEKPIEKGADKHASRRELEEAAIVSESLRKTYAPYMLRRTKEEVFGKASNDAGSLSRKKDIVVWLTLTENQRKLYKAFLESESVAAVLNKTSSALASLTVLKKICDHPALLSENAQDAILESQNQAWSFSDPETTVSVKKSFDAMRESFEWKSVLEDMHASSFEASCKSIFVMNLLRRLVAQNHRTLIFSQSKVMLDILETAIKGHRWRFCRIDGSIVSADERQMRVETFQNESIPVFLLTSQVGGLGLTLTAADRVIIVDPSWNPSVDAQSVDRAYRIGQTKDVLVYRLISCGTVEDKIYRKQVFKGALFRAGTESGEQSRYFSVSDLKDLFSLDQQEARHSSTQKHLEKLHGHQRQLSAEMKEEIDSLKEMGHFVGVSDHDLLYSEKASVPSEILSKAEVFKSQTPPVRAMNLKTGGTSRPSKAWTGDGDISSMFEKALSLTNNSYDSHRITFEQPTERSKILADLEKQQKLLENPSLLASLGDGGEKIRHKIDELQEKLKRIDDSASMTGTTDYPSPKVYQSKTSSQIETPQMLGRVKEEVKQAMPLEQHEIDLGPRTFQTSLSKEREISMKHAVKRNKKELYNKAKELEKLIKEGGQGRSELKKEVEALLQRFVSSKQELEQELCTHQTNNYQ